MRISKPGGNVAFALREDVTSYLTNSIVILRVAKNSQLGYEADLRKSRDAKSSDQLIKPINLERLQAAIRQVEARLN